MYAPESLFLDTSGGALPTFRETDAFFASRGFVRPPLDLRGMSARPRPSRPCLCVWPLATSLVSAYARRHSPTSGLTTPAHGRLISSRIDYSQRQVAEYLTGLAEAGFADRWEDGRTVKYRLTPSAPRPTGPAVAYADWSRAFVALGALDAALVEAARETNSYESSVRLRAALTDLKSSLPIEGVDLPIPTPDEYPGELVLGHAEELVSRVARAVENLARPA